MTIFDTGTDQDLLRERRHAHLPTPTRDRYVPLRAGVVNVWEYDDQQFWFTDGRLLLRGRNEAGKSKVLELLFPFVLDGDTTPKKLDPFDTANKSMWWNMIGFHPDRRSAIGYLWLEFGRLDDTGTADYQTVVVGVQATRAERKTNTWFALTPQRIDVDLDLAPGSVCRTQDSFAKALSVDARFETKASKHRANVAAHVFAMAPERYDNLLHLLRQLRKPKLADKLDPRKLSAVLTDALPPLDESRIEPLAVGFGFLDADIDALRHTEAAHRATGSFLDTYRLYARAQSRARAAEVTRTNTNFDNVTREERDNQRALTNARARTVELKGQAARLARELASASGSLQGLDLSAVESLRSLEKAAAADAKVVTNLDGEASRSRERADKARQEDDNCAAAQQGESEALSDALGVARRDGDRAGLERGWDDSDDLAAAARQLTEAVKGRRGLLDAVESAELRARDLQQAVTTAAQQVADSAARCEETADLLAAATRAEDELTAALAADVEAWAADGPGGTVVADGDAVVDELAEHHRRADVAARAIAARLAADTSTAAADAVTAAAIAAANADAEHRAAVDVLAAHDSAPADTPPPARPGVGAHRAGVPLWFAVDFASHLTSDEAATLEAGLDAAGLLDAAITASGLVSGEDDTVLVPTSDGAPPTRSLTEWLNPAEGSDEALVQAALASIGAGEASGVGCWVDLDGTWANGPLAGRWSKPTVDYIGAGARAAARARRRSELEAAIERTSRAATAAATEHDAAQAHQQQVAAWVQAFPAVAGWASARQQAADATTADNKAAAEHTAARKRHGAAKAEAQGALDEVELAVTAAGCRPEQVPAVRRLLDEARDAAKDLAGAAKEYARAAERAVRAQEAREQAEAEETDVEQRLHEAQLAAAASRGAYDTAVEHEGAEVEEILAEKDRLERAVDSLRGEAQRVDDELDIARETEIRAEEALKETEARRIRAGDEREAALAALADLVRTGHVGLTVALDTAREPADYMQVFAGRTLARQVTAAVPEGEATEDARSQATDRLVREFNVLRDEVGTDFDPHLDTSSGLFVASATLNGELIGVAELHHALGDDVEQRRAAIAAEERALIEQHLRDEVGNHLGDCLHAATTQVQQMNRILRKHPTNSGATVQLQWQVDSDAGPGVRDAIQALLTSPATRDEDASAALATFLAERVTLARRGDIDGADLAERLTAALDYRSWHDFKLRYKAGTTDAEMTARNVGSGSGGQQAKVSHLPLLAAAAGFYASSPSAPRLCFLDEAFAGIDGPNTADLLAVTVTLDLDMVMTNYDAWFCVPQVPGLAVYHLEKLPGTVGVAAIRYQWDGVRQVETDPWLEP